MKIYIASRFESRDELRPVRDKLWAMGHEVVSSWLDEVKQPPYMDDHTFKRKLAIKDLTEIASADLFILYTPGYNRNGGKNVEYGFALGYFQQKLVYLVGDETNIFHALADKRFNTWDELFDDIGEEHAVH